MLIRISYLLAVVLLCGACENDQRALVVGKIQAASKLATTEFTVDKIVHGSKVKKISWVIKLNETRFLAYSQAKIKAGVDLNKIKAEDIKIEGDIIELTLPPVEVINFSYPPNSFKLDEEITDTKKFLNKIRVEDQEHFFREAELDIRNNLEYMGIVETTQQHARNMITALLKTLQFKEIHIMFSSNELIIDKVNLTSE